MRKLPSALKHGAYSGMGLLPGEDANAFKALHEELMREFGPVGAFEEDVVLSLARLLWRKQNLSTYRLATAAKACYSAIRSEIVPMPAHLTLEAYLVGGADPETTRAKEADAKNLARKDLGEAWDLVEVGEIAETKSLMGELAVIEKLDGMIDRCLKRLLYVRGFKSLPQPTEATPSSTKKGRAA